MPGTLILCGTPIGNLDDASTRLLDTLGSADVVFAEDTRRTQNLLSRFGIEAPLRSYFVGNESRRTGELVRRLSAGETVALVTDAGMPAVSDPGAAAVDAATAAGATVTVVPGPSAVSAALAVAGFGGDRFSFEGFLPRSGAARRRRLEAIGPQDRPVVVFAATSRVAQDLEALASVAGSDRDTVVTRELTKLHEEVWRGSLGGAVKRWRDEIAPRGEFTIVLAPAAGATAGSLAEAVAMVEEEVAAGARLSEAVRRIAVEAGVSRRELYEATLPRDDGPDERGKN